LEGINNQGEISEESRNEVNNILKRSFRPEFLNRLDEIVFYKPLSKTEIASILQLMFNDLKDRLKNKQLTFSVSDKAKSYIIEQGYDPIYGARPLKRYIQRNIETLIARVIISKYLEPNTNIEIDFDGKNFTAK